MGEQFAFMSNHDDFQKGFNSGSSDFGGPLPRNASEQAGFNAGQQQRDLDYKRIADSKAKFGPSDTRYTLKVYLVLFVAGGMGVSFFLSKEVAPWTLCALASAGGFFSFLMRRLLGRLGPILYCGFAGLALGSFRLVMTGGVASFENLWFNTALGVIVGLVLAALGKRR